MANTRIFGTPLWRLTKRLHASKNPLLEVPTWNLLNLRKNFKFFEVLKIRNVRVENQVNFYERNQLWFFLAFKISFSLSKLTFFQSNNRKIFTTQNLDFFGHYFYLFTAFFGIPLRSVCIHQRAVSENLSMTCFKLKLSTRTRNSWSEKVPVRSKRRRDEWDMGSNLSRQSERKEERREDFAVYDAQNYRKICEKYMLVKYIEINFWLKVGKFWKIFPKNGWFPVMSVRNEFFKNTSYSHVSEDWVEFILFPVWVKSCGLFSHRGMSNASRFMTKHVFRMTEAVMVKQSWSSLTTNFSGPYVTTINHLVWSFRSFQQIKLVCMLTLEQFLKTSLKRGKSWGSLSKLYKRGCDQTNENGHSTSL